MANNPGGKGSGARPLSVSIQKFGEEFDRIFGSKNDPVKHCEVYKKDGCAHVDGPLCNMNTCNARTTQVETSK